MSFDQVDYLSRHFQASDIEWTDKVDELIDITVPANSPNRSLYREMVITVMRMAQADRNRWDAKIMMRTLQEMENAFARLDRFKRRHKVTVFGSARTPKDHPAYKMARDLGALLAKHEVMVITGAGGGIMAAAHEGAGKENSLGFNITLPFEQSANLTISGTDRLLSFHFFFLRKLFFVKEANALVLCPGGFGTLDEALEVLTLIQTGKSPIVPVILMDEPGGSYWHDALTFMQNQLLDNQYILPSDMKLMRLVHSVEEASEELTQFYRNFHSSHWYKSTFVIRMRHALSDAAMAEIQDIFKDLCNADGYTQELSNGDHEEVELAHLFRLSFTFNGRDYGRLRELLDYINLPVNWRKPA